MKKRKKIHFPCNIFCFPILIGKTKSNTLWDNEQTSYYKSKGAAVPALYTTRSKEKLYQNAEMESFTGDKVLNS